jgi:hypothetical protein
MAPPQLPEEKRRNAIHIRHIRMIEIQAQKRGAKSQDRTPGVIGSDLFEIFDKLGVSTLVEFSTLLLAGKTGQESGFRRPRSCPYSHPSHSSSRTSVLGASNADASKSRDLASYTVDKPNLAR